MGIKLIIDSGSDISKSEADNLGLLYLGFEVTIDGKNYFDGIDLSIEDFYKKLGEDLLPKTSQINPFRYEKLIKDVLDNGDKVIVITLSSKLSGSYNSALIAAEQFDSSKVAIVDSLNACEGERILIEYALKLINENNEFEDVVNKLNEIKKRIRVIGAIDSLKYLKLGGRISTLAAIGGSLLNIKPLVSIIDGEVKVIGRAKGNKKAMIELNNNIKKTNGIDFELPYCILYSGLDDSIAKKYASENLEIFNNDENIRVFPMGCTIGTYVGFGTIGVAFFEKN